MAPPVRYPRSREDSQRKGSNPSWDKNVRTERAPRLAPGSIPTALHPRAGARGRADTRTHTHSHTHIPRHTASSGGRAWTETHSLAHPPTHQPTYAFANSSKPSNCRFRNCGIPSLKFVSSPAQPWPWLFSNPRKGPYFYAYLLRHGGWWLVVGGWCGHVWSWLALFVLDELGSVKGLY